MTLSVQNNGNTELATQWLQLLGQDPFRVEAYRALRQIYQAARDVERTFAACAALCYLQQADEEEVAFHEKLRSPRLAYSKAALSDDAWAGCVYRSDQNRFISSVFASICSTVGTIKSAEHKLFGLRRSDRRDLAADQTLFSRVFSYSAQVLNVPLPEAYFQPEENKHLQVANARERQQLLPSVLVGHGMLSGQGEKELAFRSATFLTKMRPEHYLRLILPTQLEMEVAFFGAVRLVSPAFPVPEKEQAVVEQYAQLLQKHMQPAALEALHRVVQHHGSNPGQLDLGKWVQAVDLTANRAGLIVCGDLLVAVGLVTKEPGQSQDRIKDLLLYSVSPRYFAARHFLGLSIG